MFPEFEIEFLKLIEIRLDVQHFAHVTSATPSIPRYAISSNCICVHTKFARINYRFFAHLILKEFKSALVSIHSSSSISLIELYFNSLNTPLKYPNPILCRGINFLV